MFKSLNINRHQYGFITVYSKDGRQYEFISSTYSINQQETSIDIITDVCKCITVSKSGSVRRINQQLITTFKFSEIERFVFNRKEIDIWKQ